MEHLEQILTDNNFNNVEIVTSFDDDAKIPGAWRQIASAKDIDEKKYILNTYWQPVTGQLPMTVAIINDFLKDVAVIKENGEYQLVYVFDIDDFLSVYVGHLPTNSGPFLEDLPEDIAKFYKEIHNGWYEKISGGLGFLTLEDIHWLSSHEWGVLEEIPAPDFDLNKVFYVFHNAGPGYLCINVTDPNHPEYLIFWTNKAPKEGIEFWPVMDSWIEIGLTN